MQRKSIWAGMLIAALVISACTPSGETPVETTPEPEATTSPTPARTPIPTLPGQPVGLLETLETDARFHTLVSLIEAVGFGDTLDDEGEFTLFAPNDAAFAALPAGTVEHLLQPENAQEAADLLRYHLVHQTLGANALGELSEVESTFPGHRLLLRRRGDELLVNNIRVLIGDIRATNGVIHMLEYVLQPAPHDP
ncbi:MAG TPA: fasciclin domain-containing protein [Anaerolineales bacterium]|nr:fasciclin domain-containing protein [Anaerolineales bacterium]